MLKKISFLILTLALFIFSSSFALAVAGPQKPTNLVVTPSANAVSLSWTRNAVPGTETSYNVYASYDNGNSFQLVVNLALSNTSYTVTGLSANTQYFFIVSSANGAVESVDYAISGSVYTLPQIIDATVGAQTDSSIYITWVGTAKDYRLDNLTTGVTGSYQVSANTNVSGLNCGTSYTFLLTPRNIANAIGATRTISGSTEPCPVVAPTISSFTKSASTQTSITLAWVSDGTSFYTENFTNGSNSGWIAPKTYTFSNLQCGTTYNFKLTAKGNTGLTSAVSSANFSTDACSAVAPTVTSVTKSSSSQTSLTLSWLTQSSLVGNVPSYYAENITNSSNSGWINTPSYTFSNLSCNTSYNFRVQTKDSNSLTSPFYSASFTTDLCPANTPPIVSSVSKTASSKTSITLSWTHNGVLSYAEQIPNVSNSGWINSNSYTFSNLLCGTSYNFKVQSKDNLGNTSAFYSIALSTDDCNVTAPVVSGLTVVSLDRFSATLGWGGTGQSYQVQNTTKGTTSNWQSGTSFTENNLTCDSRYTFAVTAKDANGILSAPQYLTLTTSPCPLTTPSTNDCPALNSGDMVKVIGYPAIYVLNKNKEILYFPSGDEFKSWNADNTYGNYIRISEECYSTLQPARERPLAVPFRAGSWVVKKEGTAQWYVVEPNGILTKITVSAARALYGNKFRTARSIPSGFWWFYNISNRTISEGLAHTGMVIKYNNKNWYVDNGNTLREITDTGFIANRFQPAFVRSVGSGAVAGYIIGNPITDFETDLSSRY